jgi:small subunit ribosomal protein S18
MSFNRGGRRRSYNRRPRVCQFCVDNIGTIDYKNVELLARQTGPEGKIRPRRRTGTCARHQRILATAIKRARHMALLGFDRDTWL